MLDSLDIYRERDFVHANLGNVARMLDGVRKGDASYTFTVITMNCAAAENALEAALASVRKAKSEARLIVYQREKNNPLHAFPRSAPPPRPSSVLPSVVSPAAAE